MFKPLIISLVNLFLLQHWLPSAVDAQVPTESCINGSKLCFGYPGNCPTELDFNCDILVLISVKSEISNGLDVDVYSSTIPSTDQYLAVGLNKASGMSGATVVHCDYKDSTPSVNEGYTEGFTVQDLPTGTLTEDRTARLENGFIHCHWTQKASGTAGASGIGYDIRDKYYVLLAIGPITSGSLRHHSVRSITESLVDLTSVGIIASSDTIPLAIRVHGSLMTIAWLCLVSISMVIARYHKGSWKDTKLCNVQVWFALHRGLMFSALATAIIGMITIFIHAGGWRANSPHQYLGLFANILMVLQPLGALLRPAPDHPNRIFFKIIHSVSGYIGHLLAILAIFFVSKLAITLSKVFFIILISFVGVYVATHIILQFIPHLLSKLNVIESTDMDDFKDRTNNSSTQSSHPVHETIEQSKKRVLFLFISLVIIITILLIVFINLGSP